MLLLPNATHVKYKYQTKKTCSEQEYPFHIELRFPFSLHISGKLQESMLFCIKKNFKSKHNLLSYFNCKFNNLNLIKKEVS